MAQLIILISLFSRMALADVQQDIVLKSRFDLDSSQAFISQLRIFLGNNNFGDPYFQVIDKPISIDLANTIEEVPESTQNWIRELQSVLSLHLFESNYKVQINKFSYQIEDFNSDFRAGISNDQRVEYVTVNYVKGLRLSADSITFEVELKRTHNKEPIKFTIGLIGPEFLVSPDLMAELPMGWSTSVLPTNVKLILESVDINKIMEKITLNPELIEYRIKDMIIPAVSIRVGNKEIKFDEFKIRNFFQDHKDDLKVGILELLKAKMKERFSNVIKDSPLELLLPRRYGFESEINGVFDIQKMMVNNSEIVQFDFDGHFCLNDPNVKIEVCRDNKLPTKLRRIIGLTAYQKSIREMNRSLIEKKQNIALSVSEHYLNQLIDATIQAGLWKEALKGNSFALGPEKSFVLAEEKGELFSLYLDIIYQLKSSQIILVGRSELRFPIKLMIALKVEERHGIPHFTIKVKKVATDHKLLLEGAPNLDLPSNVNNVPRFRKKVLQGIMNDISLLNHKTLIDVELKELTGTYLDQLEFFSDGLGRGTAIIGFK